jgi:predicted DNA-binding transcriptional regulator AlpA
MLKHGRPTPARLDPGSNGDPAKRYSLQMPLEFGKPGLQAASPSNAATGGFHESSLLGTTMNNRQRRILAQHIGQALTHRRRVISIPLTAAMLEMEESHVKRLERDGLFPAQVMRSDGSPGYDLGAIYEWLKDFLHEPR